VFTDPSAYKGEGASAEDLVVSIFRKNASELPSDLVRGTPVLFRRVKVILFKLLLHLSTESIDHQIQRESEGEYVYRGRIVGLSVGGQTPIQCWRPPA
jgi:hypothetical protein